MLSSVWKAIVRSSSGRITADFEEMLRAPLKAVVRTIGLERMVAGRSMELPKRSDVAMMEERYVQKLMTQFEARF
jgi:hypothetical protein